MQEWIGPGMVLGAYQIVARIEHEVFLVQAENGTPATLKLLAENRVWEPATLKRFIHAIKAAPPLDHRHICRTLDAGATNGGRPFVVSEVVHGRPLNALEIGLGRTLAERLELASQIAEAIAAAHARGILHLELTPNKVLVEYDRQLKDANWLNEYADSVEESLVAIKLTGRVKVLDFAVKMAALGAASKRATPTFDSFTTAETLPYCSPEWVNGEKLTPRSDIFSLGVLVYELLTSNRPFNGNTPEEMRAAICSQAPQPLLEFVPELSTGINEAVLKALAKDPRQRFQTAAEFAQALRGLVQEETASASQRAATAKQARAQNMNWQELWPKVRAALHGNWRRGVAGSIVLIELLFIAAILIHSRRNTVQEVSSAGPRENLPFICLTHNGKVREAALAPDASGLVYLFEEPERQSIMYKPYDQTSKEGKTLPEILLVTSKQAQFTGLSYAPSGEFVYFLSQLPGKAATLLRAPISGGPTQTVANEAASAIGFAPDRKQYVYARAQSGETQLVIAELGKTTPRVLSSWPSPNTLASIAPGWSRDGKTIVCALRRAGNDFGFELIAVDVASSQQQTLATGQWAEVYGLGWSPDNQTLLVNGRAPGKDAGQIWRIAVGARAITALTKGVDDYRGLSLTAEGTRLLTVYTEHKAEFWLGTDDQASRLPALNVDTQAGFTWLNDQQIVYAVHQPSGMQLREITTDGQPAKLFRQLDAGITPHGFSSNTTTDAQNPRVMLAAAQNQQMNLWQATRGTLPLAPLTNTPSALWPQLLGDGQTLLYSSLSNGQTRLVLRDAANAGSQSPWNQRAWGTVLSPTGERLAANTFDDQQGHWRLSIWPVKGTDAAQVFELPGHQPRRLRWTPDGRAVIYGLTEHGSENLWQQPLAGGPPVPLTKLTKQRCYDFAWSPRGQQFAILRGEPHSEAFLIDTNKLNN